MEIQAGTTQEWNMYIKEPGGTNPQQLGEKYAVFIYDNKGEIIERYSKEALTGFKQTLDEQNASEGHFKMIIEAGHCKEWRGEVYWKYMEQIEAEGHENNTWISKTAKIKLATYINDTETQYSAL